MSTRTCPDWPDLMEIAPELQFKHYTVAEAQLPGRRADADLAGRRSRDVAICCDLDKNVFYAAHTDRARRRGAPAEPLVRGPRVDRAPAAPARAY